NIPLGYGLGSSGTVVAAVYRDFCEKNDKKNGEKSGKTETEDFAMLKNKLAQMECFFHGASSGIDPLICYTKQALVIHADKTIEIAAAHTSLDGFWLIDTQKPRKTEPLVAHFKQLCLDKDYLHELTNAYIPLNELCIAAYLKRNSDLLHQSIFELSALQLVFFKNMIPDFLLTYWNEGLTSQKFCLKICGAGGGGFMLAFAKNKTDLPLFLQERVVH
ncbi:MAG: hypothetical protein RI894_2418, partial [Bacteroidota bacterium]